MAKPLSVLIVEDSESDAQLMLRLLKKAGYKLAFEQVETAAQMRAALEKHSWEIVICDYSLPQFDGNTALELLQETGLDIPFIAVSGTMGEEAAVSMMKAGAHDYVMKNNLARLAPAIERELAQAKIRRKRKQAEETLQLSEKRFRALIENSADAITLLDAKGMVIYDSPAAPGMLGYDPDEWIGKNAFELIHADDLHKIQDLLKNLVKAPNTHVNNIFRLRHKNGSWRWIEAVATNLLVDPSVKGIVVNYRDITDRKQAEDALAASETELRALFASMNDVVLVIDREGVHRKIAPTNSGLLAKPPEELIGKNLRDIFPVDQFETVMSATRQVLETHQTVQVEYHLVIDNQVKWFETSISPMDADSTLWVARDITERKRVEAALTESEERYRLLFELSPEAIAVYQDGKVVFANQAAVKLLGAAGLEELAGKPIMDFVHPDYRQLVLERSRQQMSDGKIVPVVEEKFLRLDGSAIDVDVTAAPVHYLNKLSSMVIIRDITERKRAEEALRAHADEVATLYRASAPLLSVGTDIVAVAEEIAQIMVSEFDLADCGVLLLDEAAQELKRIRRAGTFALRASRSLPLNGPGLTVAAVRTGQTIYAADVNTDPRYMRSMVETQSELAVPLKVGTAILGVLDLQSPHTDALDEHTQRLVAAFAERAALALKNAQLYNAISAELAERKRAEEALRQRLSELEAINQVSTALRAAQTLDEMLPTLLDTTLRMMHATQGAIWLYDPAKDELRPSVTRNWGEEAAGAPPQLPIKPGEGISGYVFASGQPYIAKEFRLAEHLSDTARKWVPPGIGGATIPIRAGEIVIGTFTINVPSSRELTPEEVHLLTTLSEIAGNAIQRANLHQQTQRRLEHLTALSDVDRAISSNFDLRLSLDTLLNHLIAQLGIDAADVLLFDSNSLMLECVAEHGFRGKSSRRSQPRLDKGYAGQAILNRKMVKIANISQQQGDELLTLLGTQEAFVSYYAVPLMAKGDTKGVLEIYKRAPLEPDAEWLDFLNALAGQAGIAIDNVTLFDSLQRSNSELGVAYDSTIEGWSRALDLRDNETEGHSLRVTALTMRLAKAMGISNAELVHFRRGALLHDIGKMGVPDAILLKPGKLTDEEWIVMRRHPQLAYEMLSPINYLRPALDIPYCHHEKWDGTGYPRGLAGEEIPLPARIFAIVDVCDALLSDRTYRPAWPKEKVLEHIRSLEGTHFDPQVVQAFWRMVDEI